MDCSTHSPLLCHWALVPTKRPDASCRGGLNGRPCAPPRRMHPVGADAHIGPLGIDIKSTIAERAYHSVRNRVRYTQSRWSMHPVPGGYIIRPYGVDGGACGSADCPGPGGWRADVGIGPYEKTEGGAVGADFISAHARRRVGCTIGERTP